MKKKRSRFDYEEDTERVIRQTTCLKYDGGDKFNSSVVIYGKTNAAKNVLNADFFVETPKLINGGNLHFCIDLYIFVVYVGIFTVEELEMEKNRKKAHRIFAVQDPKRCLTIKPKKKNMPYQYLLTIEAASQGLFNVVSENAQKKIVQGILDELLLLKSELCGIISKYVEMVNKLPRIPGDDRNGLYFYIYHFEESFVLKAGKSWEGKKGDKTTEERVEEQGDKINIIAQKCYPIPRISDMDRHLYLIEDSILEPLSKMLEPGPTRERFQLKIANYQEIQSTHEIFEKCIKEYISNCKDFEGSPAKLNYKLKLIGSDVIVKTSEKSVLITESNESFQITATPNTLTVSNEVLYTGDLVAKNVILSPRSKVKGRIFAENIETNGADCSEVATFLDFNQKFQEISLLCQEEDSASSEETINNNQPANQETKSQHTT